MIVGNDSLMESMFRKRGWSVVNYLGGPNPDLIQFTGGEDVDPLLYGEERHPATSSNPVRDAYESSIYHKFVGKVPMTGICRGGQFLNVCNGGKMYQHVTNHGFTHKATTKDGKELKVTSTHHQMMIPGVNGEVILTAAVAGAKATAHDNIFPKNHKTFDDDVEAVIYENTRCLCYQPHPEYLTINEPCQVLYFDFIKQYFNLGN